MTEIPIDQPLQVITEKNMSICLAELSTDMKHVLRALNDIEERLRKQEQRDEDCQQTARLTDIETRLDGHDKDISGLKKTHNIDEGTRIATISTREYIAFCVMIGLALLNLWQAFK